MVKISLFLKRTFIQDKLFHNCSVSFSSIERCFRKINFLQNFPIFWNFWGFLQAEYNPWTTLPGIQDVGIPPLWGQYSTHYIMRQWSAAYKFNNKNNSSYGKSEICTDNVRGRLQEGNGSTWDWSEEESPHRQMLLCLWEWSGCSEFKVWKRRDWHTCNITGLLCRHWRTVLPAPSEEWRRMRNPCKILILHRLILESQAVIQSGFSFIKNLRFYNLSFWLKIWNQLWTQLHLEYHQRGRQR